MGKIENKSVKETVCENVVHINMQISITIATKHGF